MEIKEQQARDSIRIVWNVMSSHKSEQAQAGVPQALHYTPLMLQQETMLGYHPPQCQQCQAYMNPYNRIHINRVAYACCICKSQNKLPQSYLSNKQQYPAQLSLNYSSFVVTKQSKQIKAIRMGYFFVVDLCLEEKELRPIQQSILSLVSHLEDDYHVGLITYNKFANLYDLTSKMSKVHSFSAFQEYQALDLRKMLKINPGNNKYLTNLGQCRENVIKIVKGLSKCKPMSYKHQRQARSIGTALNLAISLNQIMQNRSKIIFFCGGPCTVGLGQVIEQDYKMQMRSIKQSIPKLSKAAQQYYSKLARKAKSLLIPIDSFIFSVQEVGLFEMSELLTCTGGLLVQHEEFDSPLFRQSFRKAYLQPDLPLQIASQSFINIKCSKQIVLTQHFTGETLGKKSEATIVLGDINQFTTITVMYELQQTSTDSQAYYIQFKTNYYYPLNLSVIFERVTTIRRLFSDQIRDLASGFDQGAALALVARLSITKATESSPDEVRQWLDNNLCRWVARYGTYRPGDVMSFRLSQKIKLFPQFIYNLRKNAIVRRSGMSLDEYIYLVQIIKRQTVQNIMLIIQPALLQYTLQHPQMRPVPLDEKYMKQETILVLDTFFNVVEWRGKNIQESIQSSNIQSPDYENIRKILKNIENDVQNIKSQRFPCAYYYLTNRGHSKERFIKSRLSLRQHHEQLNFSDEADVNTFTQKLIELVVNKKYT